MSSQETKINSGYLVYLFSVGKNSVVCGIDTTGGVDTEGNEVRTPCSYHTAEKLNSVLEDMDRHAKQIDSWETFYQWLGKGNGWAFFPVESALEIASHWLSPNMSIACNNLEEENGNPVTGRPFVDSSLAYADFPSEAEMIDSWEKMAGDIGNAGKFRLSQVESNMAITKQSLFVF